MNNFINKTIEKAKAFANSRVGKTVIVGLGVLGVVYGLGHVFNILTFTTVAIKGFIKALVA